MGQVQVERARVRSAPEEVAVQREGAVDRTDVDALLDETDDVLEEIDELLAEVASETEKTCGCGRALGDCPWA
jgi:hypothetical protein